MGKHDTMIEYKVLEQQLSLQRYPFVTIADTLHNLYDSLINHITNGEKYVDPLDFAIYEYNDTLDETGKLIIDRKRSKSFKYIIGYSEKKIENIFNEEKKEGFFTKRKIVNDVFRGTNEEYLARKMRNVLTENGNVGKLKLLNAVFHLAFLHKSPHDMFIEGIVQKNITKYKYLEGELINENDAIGLPKVKINGKIFQQVREEQIFEYNKYESFRKWIEKIQAGDKKNYHYFVYFPVYDGLDTRKYKEYDFKGAFIGYLGVFYKRRDIRERIIRYITSNFGIFQEVIKESIKEGIFNQILDEYGIMGENFDEYRGRDPVLHWFRSIYTYQHWNRMIIKSRNNVENIENYTWRFKNYNCIIYLKEILSRDPIKKDHEDLLYKYNDVCLVLELPQEIKGQIDIQEMDEKSDYLKKRIRDAIALLDALLEKEKLFKQMKEVETHARKAAVAQVMSRNMSHNIGSHVLAALTQYEESYGNITVKILLNYLKHRQEFIADISTTSAYVTFNRYLYQDILSKLLPLCEQERKGKQYYQYLISNDRYFECYPHLLLDHISGKSDVKADNIKINIIKQGQNQVKVFFDDLENRKVKNDILVSFPNDVLGAHALYVIFENIIRNACKHSILNENIEFTISVEDRDNDYYTFSIIDNLGHTNKNERAKKNFLPGLQRHINNSILTENKLRDEGWGFLEMKICAAYLLRYPIEEIDRFYDVFKTITLNGKTYPPLLAIDYYNDKGERSLNNSHYNLGFTFHLLKPKLVHVIDLRKKDGIAVALDKEIFKKSGIHTGYTDGINKYGTDHEFLAIIGDNDDGETIELNTNQRVINVTDNDLENIEIDIDKTKRFLYSKYISENIKEPLFASSEGGINGNSDDIDNGILFDDHGCWIRKFSGDKDRLCYYEPYNNKSLTKHLFIDPYNDESTSKVKKDVMKYEINEAAKTETILLDERIQNIAVQQTVIKDESDDYEIKRIEILNSTRVYVPTLPEANLGENDISIEKTISYTNDRISSRNIEYLIIHLGIIEKLAESTEKNVIETWINNHKTKSGKSWLEKRNQYKQFKIVVTSGRGLPSNLPDDILYVPISLIYQYAISYPSKIMLTKLLKSVRKYRRKG